MSKFQFVSKDIVGLKDAAESSGASSFQVEVAENSECKLLFASKSEKTGLVYIGIRYTDANGHIQVLVTNFKNFEESLKEDKDKIVWNDKGTKFTVDLEGFRFNSDGESFTIVPTTTQKKAKKAA